MLKETITHEKFVLKENLRIEFSTHEQRFPFIKFIQEYIVDTSFWNHTHFKLKYQIRVYRIHLSFFYYHNHYTVKCIRVDDLFCLVRNRFLYILLSITFFFSHFLIDDFIENIERGISFEIFKFFPFFSCFYLEKITSHELKSFFFFLIDDKY